MKALLAALAIALAAPALAAEPQRVQTLERAEISGTYTYGVSQDGFYSSWTPITLPHNWYRNPPPGGRDAWYRLRVTFDAVPLRSQSLYLARLPVRDLVVRVNDQQIWKLSERFSSGAALTAVVIPIPEGLMKTGENVIHLYATGSSRWYSGVPRVHVGDTQALSGTAGFRNLIQGQTIQIVGATFGALGLLALFLWFRAGRDPVLFWYAVTGIGLLAVTMVWYLTLWRDDFESKRAALVFLRYNGYLMPLFILHLRFAGLRYPMIEIGMWLVFVVAVVSTATPGPWQGAAWTGWGILFAMLPALFILPLLRSRALRREPAVMLLIGADAAGAVMNLHDWALRLGWVDFERPYFVYYVPGFVMLAAAVPILDRLLAGFDATRRMNVELERRVAAKAREIESSQERLRSAQRGQALAEERRRIMADMHDGLGARLVALLSLSQSGKARPEELSEGIASALDELRLAIDSVQPVEGDVGVVLGSVRHRMRSVFERAGVRFLWNVSELPRMEDLTPERILAIQRIFLEVFSNAIKHSRAQAVAVYATRVPGAVHIVIEDDGCGFDASALHAGHGLANLKLRASQAGGSLGLESAAGKGTRVTLSLPFDGKEPPADMPRTGEGRDSYPVQGMSPKPSTA